MDENQKKQLEDEIVRTMIQALNNKSITDEQMSIISTLVLDKIDEVHNELELKEFLSDLAARWHIFKPLLVLRFRDMQEKVEDEVAEGVLLLAKHGKIEDAIKLAKSVTSKS